MGDWNVVNGLAVHEEDPLAIMNGVMLSQLRCGNIPVALFEDEVVAKRVAGLLNRENF